MQPSTEKPSLAVLVLEHASTGMGCKVIKRHQWGEITYKTKECTYFSCCMSSRKATFDLLQTNSSVKIQKMCNNQSNLRGRRFRPRCSTFLFTCRL